MHLFDHVSWRVFEKVDLLVLICKQLMGGRKPPLDSVGSDDGGRHGASYVLPVPRRGGQLVPGVDELFSQDLRVDPLFPPG